MDIHLHPITKKEDVEWLRVTRNDPRLYKYFRQDKEITIHEQNRWWRNLRKDRAALFAVIDKSIKPTTPFSQYVGYVGFLPLNRYASQAEFGIFICPDYHRSGYGSKALIRLLDLGFNTYHLSTIYSDTLMYPGEEKRWSFFEKLGFTANPAHSQGIHYRKQGKMIPSLKFYMTKEMFMEKHGSNRDGGLASSLRKAVGAAKEALKGQG